MYDIQNVYSAAFSIQFLYITDDDHRMLVETFESTAKKTKKKQTT